MYLHEKPLPYDAEFYLPMGGPPADTEPVFDLDPDCTHCEECGELIDSARAGCQSAGLGKGCRGWDYRRDVLGIEDDVTDEDALPAHPDDDFRCQTAEVNPTTPHDDIPF